MFKKIILLLFLGVFLVGCTENASFENLSPTEAGILSHTTMYLGLKQSKTPLDQAELIKNAVNDTKVILLAVLQQDPENIFTITVTSIDKLSAEYRPLVDGLLQLLLSKLRPLIDQGKTDKAAEYINQVLTGASKAVDKYIGGLADANYLGSKFSSVR